MKQYDCKTMLPDAGSIVCNTAEQLNAVIYHLAHNGFFETYKKHGFVDENLNMQGACHTIGWDKSVNDYYIAAIPMTASRAVVTFYDFFKEVEESDENDTTEVATEKTFFMEREIIGALVKEYGYDYILEQVKKFENLTYNVSIC